MSHHTPLIRNLIILTVFSVAFSADDKELLGGANDGCIYIYDRSVLPKQNRNYLITFVSGALTGVPTRSLLTGRM